MAEHERKTPGGLPTFEVLYDDGVKLDAVGCPRGDCRETFYVPRGRLARVRQSRGFETASCPFCMRVALVPGTSSGQQALTDG